MFWHWRRMNPMPSARSAWWRNAAAITSRPPTVSCAYSQTWPDDSDLRVCLGIALYEQGKVDEAVKHLRLACELCADLRTRLVQSRRSARTRSAFARIRRRVAARDPARSRAHHRAAFAGARAGEPRPHRRGDRRIPRSAAPRSWQCGRLVRLVESQYRAASTPRMPHRSDKRSRARICRRARAN